MPAARVGRARVATHRNLEHRIRLGQGYPREQFLEDVATLVAEQMKRERQLDSDDDDSSDAPEETQEAGKKRQQRGRQRMRNHLETIL